MAAPPSSRPRPGLQHLTVEVGEAHDEEHRGDEAAGGHDINDIIMTHLVTSTLPDVRLYAGKRCHYVIGSERAWFTRELGFFLLYPHRSSLFIYRALMALLQKHALRV